MNVAILTKSGSGYGYGHLRRSLVLSDFLSNQGIDSVVLNVSSNLDGLNVDVVITDFREVSSKELKQLIKLGKPIISFDDTETYKPYVVSVMPLPYITLSGPNPNYEGIDFLVLDPVILSYGNEDIKYDVLVSFGGEDPNNLTEFVLSGLSETKVFEKFRVGVVIGKLFKNKNKIEGLCEKLGVFALRPESHDDVIEAIASSRLVLTSFGMTVYESLVLGKKVVLLNNSEYHELIFRKSGLTDFVESLGVHYEFDSLRLLEVIGRILSDEDNFKMLGVNLFENLDRVKSLVERVYSSWDEEKYQCLLLHDVFCTYRGDGISEFFCKDCTKRVVFRF